MIFEIFAIAIAHIYSKPLTMYSKYRSKIKNAINHPLRL